MNEDVPAHVRNAHERPKDAERIISLARYVGAVNRTYWTMFEAACAILASRGVKVETMRALRSSLQSCSCGRARCRTSLAARCGTLLSSAKLPIIRSAVELRSPAKSQNRSYERRQNFWHWRNNSSRGPEAKV